MSFLHNFRYILHAQPVAVDEEDDIVAGEVDAIFACWIALVGRAWVVFQDGYGRRAAIGRQAIEQMLREGDLQRVVTDRIGKAAGRVRMGVGKGKIWLDVVDGSAVHQIGATNVQNTAV